MSQALAIGGSEQDNNGKNSVYHFVLLTSTFQRLLHRRYQRLGAGIEAEQVAILMPMRSRNLS